MKKFNIMTAKKYTKADGTIATKWIKLGTVVQKDDGKMFGDLDVIPTGSWFDGAFQVFEIEQNNHHSQPQHNQYNKPQQNSYSYIQ